MFNVPISIKWLTTGATALVLNFIATKLHVGIGEELKTLIASAIALGIGWAVPEVQAYVQYWLKKAGLPVDLEVVSGKKP